MPTPSLRKTTYCGYGSRIFAALVRDDSGMYGGGLPHTIRNTTAPSAPAHNAMAAMLWIAKPMPRLAAAFE